jgi:hypothetical protein
MNNQRIVNLTYVWFVLVFAAGLGLGIAVGRMFVDALALVLVAMGILLRPRAKATVAVWALAFYLVASGASVVVFWTSPERLLDAASASVTMKTIVGVVLHFLLLGHSVLLCAFCRARV